MKYPSRVGIAAVVVSSLLMTGSVYADRPVLAKSHPWNKEQQSGGTSFPVSELSPELQAVFGTTSTIVVEQSGTFWYEATKKRVNTRWNATITLSVYSDSGAETWSGRARYRGQRVSPYSSTDPYVQYTVPIEVAMKNDTGQRIVVEADTVHFIGIDGGLFGSFIGVLDISIIEDDDCVLCGWPAGEIGN